MNTNQSKPALLAMIVFAILLVPILPGASGWHVNETLENSVRSEFGRSAQGEWETHKEVQKLLFTGAPDGLADQDPQRGPWTGDCSGRSIAGELYARFTRSLNKDGQSADSRTCVIVSPNTPDAVTGALNGGDQAWFTMYTNTGMLPPGDPDIINSEDVTNLAFHSDTTIHEITARLYLSSLRGRTVTVDYHEIGGSPTIEEGVAPGLQPTDFNFIGRGEISSYGVVGEPDMEMYTVHTGAYGPGNDLLLGFGKDGHTIAAGNQLGVRIYIQETDQLGGLEEADPTLLATPVNFGFEGTGGGAKHSDMFIVANTARTNIWTENRFNEVAELFPQAGSVPAQDRHVEINVVHANTWGNEVLNTQRFEDFNIEMKIMKGDTEIVSPRSARPEGALSDGIDFYSFHFDYPSFLPDGTYTAVVFTPQWEASRDFIVGEIDFGLRLHKDELQTHTIKAPHPDPFGTDIIVERTEFVLEVVNSGLQPDTIAVSVKPIGEGWTSDLTKSAIPLQPGEKEEIVLTVFPDERARPGDVKNITVEGIGTITGKRDKEVVRVILTDQDKFGVELFSDKKLIQMRPGQTLGFPATIRNTGHELDTFALATNDLPRGWRVQIDPKSVEVHPASKNSIGVTLTSPKDAVPGTTFLLRLKATSVDNALTTTTLEIPVKIFLEQSFKFDELSGVKVPAIGGQTQLVYSLHNMRDEGKGRAIGADNNYWDSSAESRGSDVWFDQTSIFRLELENLGDLPDTYELSAKWLKDTRWATEYQDFGGCDNAVAGSTSPDGVPDGWRFDFDTEGNALGLSAVAQRSFKIEKVDVEPNSKAYVWAELGYFIPNSNAQQQGNVKLCGDSFHQGPNKPNFCPDNTGGPGAGTGTCWVKGARPSDPSLNAIIEVTATSTRDPTLTPKKVILHASLICATLPSDDPDCDPRGAVTGREEPYNRWSASQYNVVVDVDANEPYLQQVTVGNKAVHKVRVTSLSNEITSLLIDVPRFNKGWEYNIATIQRSLMYGNQGEGSADSLGPVDATWNPTAHPSYLAREAGCVKDKQQSQYRCTMGYGDEALIYLEVTPPADAKIGDFNVQELTVTNEQALTRDNKDQGGEVPGLGGIVADTVTLTTEFTGAYKFELDRPFNNMPVYPTETTTFPFSIRNIGTAGDQFTIEVTDAPDGWRYGLSGDVGFTSTGVQSYIAGNHNYHGFLAVEPPHDLDPDNYGKPYLFRILVSSETGQEFGVVDLFAVPQAGQDQLLFTGDPLEVFARPGDLVAIRPTVTQLQGNAGEITYTLNTSRMPENWVVSNADDVSTNPEHIVVVAEFIEDEQEPPNKNATTVFTVQLPKNEIGTSRAALCMDAEANNGVKRTYCMIVNLAASQYGVFLSPGIGGTTHVVAPGGLSTIEFYLENTGLGADFIDLDHSTLPAGWDVTFQEGSPVPLDPLERIPVIMQVRPPANLAPDVSRPIVIHAASQMDPTMTDNLEMVLTTGVAKYRINMDLANNLGVVPLERNAGIATITNVGTVADRVHLQGNIPYNPDVGSGAVSEVFDVRFDRNDLFLKPGQSADVMVSFTVLNRTNVAGQPFPTSGDLLQLNITAQSLDPLFNQPQFHGYKHFMLNVLRFVMADVDGDGGPEYAVDRNQNRDLDGYESFYDPPSTAKASTSPDLSIYLTEEAKESKKRFVLENGELVEKFVYVIDGDGDGRMDHFIDVDADVFPDLYWSPDNKHLHEIQVAKDVTGDGSLELFVDVDGDGLLDAFFDMVQGVFGRLIQVDVDGDGHIDYIVDINNDGRVQKNEPILFGFKGKVLKIHEVADMDGDGLPDTVVDSNADGRPDFFIRNGETKGVPIKMRDVNGDGVLDWAFDADEDGRLDSYYDPVAKKSYRIDTGSAFISAMRDYWYVSALFIVVIGLFIVLVAVTRR